MSLKTRLDGRSELNNSFEIRDARGQVIAEIAVTSDTSVNLEIETLEDHYIEKPSGWTSKQN